MKREPRHLPENWWGGLWKTGMDAVKTHANVLDIFRVKANLWVCWGSPWASQSIRQILLQCFKDRLTKKKNQNNQIKPSFYILQNLFKGGLKNKMQTWKINNVARAKTEQERKERGNAHQLNTYWKSFSLPAFKLQCQHSTGEKLLHTLGSDKSDGHKGFLNQYS